MFFNKETADYIRDILRNNERIHLFNYKYLYRYLFFNKEKNKYNFPSIIEYFNYNINITFQDTSNVASFFYHIIDNLLRSELQFNINQFIKDRYFINVIKVQFYESFMYDWDDNSDYLKNQIEYSKKFLSCLYDIIYDDEKNNISDYDYKINVEAKENYKNIINLTYDTIVNFYVTELNYDFSNSCFSFNELEFNNLKFGLLSQRFKKIEEEKYKNNTNSNISEDNIDYLNTSNDDIEIKTIKTNLSIKQANCLIKGLISLECIKKGSEDNMLSFLEIKKHKQPINSIKWGKSKMLCAYFVDKFNTDILKNDRIVWKPFEVLFSQNNLNGSRNHYKNKTSVLPAGYKEIDKIFDKLISI